MTSMKIRILLPAACLLVLVFCCAPRAAASPVALAASSDGSLLFVAETEPPGIVLVDPVAGAVTATWPLDAPPTGVALSTDGAKLWVTAGVAPGRVITLDATTGKVLASMSAGHSPRGPLPMDDGTRLFVCNQFKNRVEVIDPVAGKIVGAYPAVREPYAAALRPDGRALFVVNLLPAGRADTGDISAAVTAVDTGTGENGTIRLPNGSMDVRDITISPDGRFAYLTHTLARYGLPTTQLDRGWMNTSALSILDAAKPRFLATILLDEIDLGAANPAGVACSPDGRSLAVAHAGTHEISVIDRRALHERIDRAERGEKVTEVSDSLADLANDLSFLHGIRQRVQLTGNGPRVVVPVAGGFAVAAYFSHTLHLLAIDESGKVSVRDMALTPPPTGDLARRGERLFYDATSCFQHWQSCITCHPGVRTDALNWDLLNDGIGNPKQTKSLLLALDTPPAMISGIRADAETAIRAGFRHIQFAVRPEEEALAIEAFLRSLKPLPSPALVNGQLSEAARRGKVVFEKAACAHCHNGPNFTDMELHDVGTGLGSEKGLMMDTPTLRESWRTAPYLHDGRAATLDEVLGEFNPGDLHGKTSRLSPEERRDLLEYMLSL